MSSAFQDDSLHTYSDAELVQLIRSTPIIAPMSMVAILSTTLISKCYRPSLFSDVIKTIELAQQLGIRVPKIQRVVAYENDVYCIMERIQGPTLEDAWPKLSWFRTLKVALQLRRFVNLLRSVTWSTAGSLATGECRSFWLDDYFGLPARSQPAFLASFLHFWANFTSFKNAIQVAKSQSMDGVPPQSARYVPPVPQALVFTHHDLAPRNIILDMSNQLWLLDWDYAGFYPTCFEYAALQNFDAYHNWSLIPRLHWNIFSWIAVGRYERDARILKQIRSKFTRFAAGRRWELLKTGGPSRRHID